ncbi:MAG: hypothetical protein WCD18_04660, partial [Thermosynechococcaceae cyanobacterium]
NNPLPPVENYSIPVENYLEPVENLWRTLGNHLPFDLNREDWRRSLILDMAESLQKGGSAYRRLFARL